jgi:hypothetical protein
MIKEIKDIEQCLSDIPMVNVKGQRRVNSPSNGCGVTIHDDVTMSLMHEMSS